MSLQSVSNMKLLRYLELFFHIKSSKLNVSSEVGVLATLQMLSSHVWPVSTVLGGAVQAHSGGFSSCGALGHVGSLWHMDLVFPQHVGSSQTRDQTCVPCTGRRTLNHWTTREVQ